MAVMTKDEYIESLRRLKPTAYMFGEKVENVVDNPRLRAGIEATGATYALAEDPQYRDLVVTMSPFINEPVNRFTQPPTSLPDLVARVKINRLLGTRVGTCHQRCTGLDCLSALAIVTYDTDQKNQTDYNKRFHEYLKYDQKHDLNANAGVTDDKGDRSWAPATGPIRRLRPRGGKNARASVVRGAQVPPDRLALLPRDSSCCPPGPCARTRATSPWPSRALRHQGPEPRGGALLAGHPRAGRLRPAATSTSPSTAPP